MSAARAHFIPKQRREESSSRGVAPGDLRQINNYRKVSSGGHEAALIVELLGLRRTWRN